MAEITAGLVKQLREKTGAGMMDCKKALNETDGNLDDAVDYLRKKGLAAAQKKAGRTAAEGLVGLVVDGTAGALVEVNAETDFVARNEQFQRLVERIAGKALATDGDVEALKRAELDGGQTVEASLTDAIATIGENMNLRRAEVVQVDSGAIGSYLHDKQTNSLGKIGVLVALKSTGEQGKLAELGRQIAMHVAASQPQAVTVEQLDPALIERERKVLTEQAEASGKPANVVEKMVEGRLRKFYEESVLLEQPFVIDPDKKVKQVVADAAKAVGAEIEVTRFVRFALGEGIEKGGDDFAGEVAALAGH